MISAIDETELARLEKLALRATAVPYHYFENSLRDGHGNQIAETTQDHDDFAHDIHDTAYIAAACNAVPALVAEVRRLRVEAKQGGIDYCALMDRYDAQFVRAEKLREEVNWLAKMCATHCRDKSFDNAQCSIQDCAPLHCYHASAEQWKEAAREAAHADRE